MNSYTCFNIEFLKLCLRKEKTKREKRTGRKKAKRMQRRVSLLSGLGAGVALPGARGGRGPAKGRVLAEMCPAWILPCVAGYVLVGSNLPLHPLPTLPLIFPDRGYGWRWPLPSTLVLPSGGGSKQKCGGTPGTPPALRPLVTCSSESLMAGVQAGTLGAVFTALVCVSFPLAPPQPLLGVPVPLFK